MSLKSNGIANGFCVLSWFWNHRQNCVIPSAIPVCSGVNKALGSRTVSPKRPIIQEIIENAEMMETCKAHQKHTANQKRNVVTGYTWTIKAQGSCRYFLFQRTFILIDMKFLKHSLIFTLLQKNVLHDWCPAVFAVHYNPRVNMHFVRNKMCIDCFTKDKQSVHFAEQFSLSLVNQVKICFFHPITCKQKILFFLLLFFACDLGGLCKLNCHHIY